MPRAEEKKQRNQEIIEMLKTHTTQETAQYFGISRQAVYKIGERYNKKYGEITSESRGPSAVVYPEIRQYLLDNQIPMYKFCNSLEGCPNTDGKICRFLYGVTDKVPLKTVNKILSMLGKTYEEVFLLD